MFAIWRYTPILFQNLDIFLPPQPYPSWVVNTEFGYWEAPIQKPTEIEGKVNIWNEETLSWEEEELPTPIVP